MQEMLDPRVMIAKRSMTFRQRLVLFLCVVLNGLDGFDVFSISFASTGIVKDWGIDSAALGLVLSIELFGMAAGSVAFGQAADRIGRRAIAMLCLAIMATGMLLAVISRNVIDLVAVRFVTGLGIGGLLAAISAIAAGVSNERSRTMSVALMAAGYPLGAVIGGSISAQLLVSGTWRDVFLLGAILTAFLLPVVFFIFPEDLESIIRRKRGHDLLKRINQSLAKLGHEAIAEAGAWQAAPKPRFSELVSKPLGRVTATLVGIYFLHMLTFYFMLKWVPKLVSDQGFDQASAASVLVWANIGGVAGSFLFSYLTGRLPLRKLMIAALAGSALFVALFGIAADELVILALAAGAAGFCSNAAIVGLYALTATTYPAHLRGGGTGLVIGLGRGGSALGPLLGGALFSAGFGQPAAMLTMAAGSALAAGAVLLLRGPQVGEAKGR